MTEVEGVIKFAFTKESGSARSVDIAELRAWREILVRLGMLGQSDGRYGGLGFGNISMRTPDGFLVSGSQTGALDDPGLEGYAEITGWDLAANHVTFCGAKNPSSESLTHAAIYELGTDINVVFHGHSPEIWSRAADLGLPTTPSGIAYGTQQMAVAVRDLFPGSVMNGAFAMGGHEDGIIAFGYDAETAGLSLIRLYAAALQE